MPISPDSVALAVVCRPNGALAEIIYDELGVKPSQDFFSLVHASSRRKAKRFLKTAVASHSALDWELNITLAHGIVTLYFSASMTSKGIVVIGTKDAARSASVPKNLLPEATIHPETVASSVEELNARKQAKARTRRRLRTELLRLTKAAVHQVASDKLESKTFTGGQIHLLRILAHDLRNPISGILAASEYLIEDASTLLDEQHVTLLRSIESSSALLLRLIEDLLEGPPVGNGKPRLHFQLTDLWGLVEQSTAIHRPLAQAKNIQMEVRKNGAVPLLQLDPLKMAQAVNTLLTNAVRVSVPGSSIEVVLAARPERVVISIRQAGIPDSPSESSADGVRSKRKSPDAGALILGRVRSIVKGHGGEIRVQNSDRRPSFTLTLPRSQPRN
jgi:K+-sensing histidine kinase KdpD